jgi:hypothetical protein
MGLNSDEYRSSEAVKTWMDGSERRFDTFTIAEYGLWDEAQSDERELEDALKTQGLQAAMNQAERMAVEGGYLDPQRDDPRVFFENDAPPDPFTTEHERAMEREMQHEETPQNLDYTVDAISANGSSHLDVTKAWGEDEHAHLIIPQPDWDTAQANAQTAYDLLLNDDLQGAMTLVEVAGIEAGVIDRERDDPRLFTQGPPDPFTTTRERELAQTVDISEMDTEPFTPVTLEAEAPGYPAMLREFAAEAAREREANAALEGSAWFEATFEKSETELLQPVNDSVNYAVVVQEADPWTLELAVEKYWKDPGGYLGVQSFTLDTYDSDDDWAREQAGQAHDALLEVYDRRGLEAMMHQAELTAMQHDWLQGDRPDSRLFTQGPPDRFETLAQRLEGEVNPYWNTDGEKIEDPVPQPEHENPYWRLDRREAIDPDGDKLGQAMFCTVFPDTKDPIPDFDTPQRAQVLEIAHFATAGAADKFEQDFRGYLIPGLFDGSELAEAVAQLEEMPGTWIEMDGQETQKFFAADAPPLVRAPADWHPYNPNAEREARLAVDGLSADPILPKVEQDEPESVPNTPELDF